MKITLVNVIALSIGAFLANIYAVDAISCYVSASTSLATAATVQTGCTVCEKDVTTVPFLSSVVVKACATSCTAFSAGFAGAGTSVYCCSYDLCNSASSTHINLALGMMVATVSFLLLRR